MKIKQINLWIEVCPFSKEIIYRVDDNNNKNHFLWCDVYNFVFINRLDFARTAEERSSRMYLVEGQNKQSMIQAIYDYQKSLLPKGWVLMELDLTSIVEAYKDGRYNSKEAKTFYDYRTRVITITKFERK
jgi:hypothetical protein